MAQYMAAAHQLLTTQNPNDPMAGVLLAEWAKECMLTMQ